MSSRLAVLPFASTLALALLAGPQQAEACGGTFCDNLPVPMPVDQRGEDILFVLDGSTVEVHVRIQYTGEAERFAWILPIHGIPEITVGSDPLFTALSNSVAPQWSADNSACEDDEETNGDEGPGPMLDLGGGPDVVYSAVVGAFEVVVLEGGTAAEVIEFLDANDYAQDPQAEPILQEYLDEGFLFAAVKLAAGSDVAEIHPLTFRFAGDEPCVPIRLTRIAAEEDMGIRAYFLGQDRWAPSSYQHVVLNPLAYDWQSSSELGYLELLSLAVDEAGGRGFVTEYAGPSEIVIPDSIHSDSWDETAFIGVDPIVAIDLIDSQGLATHPLIRALLTEFIPPPDGIDPQSFWNNIADYEDLIDLTAWDDVAFAAALSERIIEPGLHAVDLLETWPKLTRLNTTISPAEMTVDPTFVANPDLPDVSNVRVTTINQVCGADQVFHVDVDGTDTPVCVPAGSAYPSTTDGWDMPFALRIEQVPETGPAQVITDNSAVIAAAQSEYAMGVECLAGGDEETGTSGEPTYDLPYSVTCACSTEDPQSPIGVALGLAALALIGPRRRRRAS